MPAPTWAFTHTYPTTTPPFCTPCPLAAAWVVPPPLYHQWCWCGDIFTARPHALPDLPLPHSIVCIFIPYYDPTYPVYSVYYNIFEEWPSTILDDGGG